MDHPPLNPTRSPCANGRFTFRSFNSSFPLSHRHFLNGSLGPLGSHPPPPYHSSLPCSAHPSRRQPPLLPLPDSKSTPAVSPPKKKTATTTRFNQQQHKRKARPLAKPKNEKATILVTAQKSKEETWEEEQDERGEDIMESIYSISPPPSSLPLPRFSLPRPKSASPAASCVMEAVEGGGGGIDIGATDSLRRLLRL